MDVVMNLENKMAITWNKKIEDKTIEDLIKSCPDKIKILEEALLNYMGENDLKISKTEFPDKWK